MGLNIALDHICSPLPQLQRHLGVSDAIFYILPGESRLPIGCGVINTPRSTAATLIPPQAPCPPPPPDPNKLNITPLARKLNDRANKLRTRVSLNCQNNYGVNNYSSFTCELGHARGEGGIRYRHSNWLRGKNFPHTL